MSCVFGGGASLVRVSVFPCFCFSVVVGRASSVRERIVRDESDGLKIED